MRSGRVNYGRPVNWAHPLTRGLLAWWLPLPNWSGGLSLRDLCGRRHGTLANPLGSGSGPQWGASPFGPGAITFDGSDDTVTVPAISAVTGAAQLSAACWVKPASAGGGNFGRIFHSDDQSPFALFMNGAATSASWSINGNSINGTLAVGEWSHLLGTYDGATLRFYVNGAEASSTAVSGAVGTCNTIYISDRSGFGRAFDGPMTDWVLWNRGLSAAEARGWYEQARRGHPATLTRSRRQGIDAPAAAAPGGGNRRRRLILSGGR